MLKKFFSGLLALILLASGVSFSTSLTTNVTAAGTVTIQTPFEFCNYFFNRQRVIVGESNQQPCSAYSNVVGAPLTIDGIYRIDAGVDVVLKNMNLTYNSLRAPFTFSGGHLTIDGGSYTTAGSCFFYISYNQNGNSNASNLTINSGDFEALGGVGRYSQTPICIVYPASKGDDFNTAIFQSLLGPNSYYAEYGTATEINVKTNLTNDVESTYKDHDAVDEITCINRARLSVREREPSRGEVTPAPEPEPEEPTTPETTPTPIVIPKAPNTGVGR